MFSLDGKVAVITGGGSGIGLMTAKRFRKAGAKIVIADIAEENDTTAAAADLYVKTDVSKEDDVIALMEAAADKFGKIDIVVNNAGIMYEELPIPHVPEEHFTKMFQVNTLGVLFGMKHAIAHMDDGGSIINTSSLAGATGIPTYAAYCASKWPVVGLTKVAALEYGPAQVRVNCICPGSVDTPMLASQPGGELEKEMIKLGAAIGRINKPEDVAALIHFLASDDCSTITGQAINIDGGFSAGISTNLIETVTNAIGLDG